MLFTKQLLAYHLELNRMVHFHNMLFTKQLLAYHLELNRMVQTMLLQHVRLLINTSSIATSRDQMFQWKLASSSTSERWCLEKLVLSTRTEVLDQSLFGSHKYDQQCNFKHNYLTVFVPVYAFECKLNLSCSGSKQIQQVTKMCI